MVVVIEPAVIDVVLRACRIRWHPERIARHLVDALTPSFTIVGREVSVSASMGLMLSTEVGLDPETVLRDTDTALYQAKASGKAYG